MLLGGGRGIQGKLKRKRLSIHSVRPIPTIATIAIIKRTCFMPATLRLTGSGVNAVGGVVCQRADPNGRMEIQ